MRQELSKLGKVAETKVLTEFGYSIRKISELTGLATNTVMAYQHKEMTPELQLFSDTIKKLYLEQDFELSQLAYKEIKGKINEADFRDVVGLLKIVRELQAPQGINLATQVNISLPSWAKDES